VTYIHEQRYIVTYIHEQRYIVTYVHEQRYIVTTNHKLWVKSYDERGYLSTIFLENIIRATITQHVHHPVGLYESSGRTWSYNL